jgi:cardiolipin synthase
VGGMMRFNFNILKKLPAHEKRITLPTWLTIGRIVLIPFIVWAMIMGYWATACVLFIIAAITDVLDGYLARTLNQQTFLGASLDPFADKLLLLTSFFTLAFVDSPLFAVPLWFAFIVLLKEVVILGGGIYLYLTQGHLEIKPTRLGKTTTFIQICFILWLFACYFFDWEPIKTYHLFLAVMVVVVVSALFQYIVIGVKKYLVQS